MDIKKILSLLTIVLPALIILMGIIRIFLKNGKGIVNGFTMLFAILLLLIGLVKVFIIQEPKPCDNEPGPPPLAVGKHSDDFNGSVQDMLDAYISLKDALVKKDIGFINQSGQALRVALDSIKLDELKKDTIEIYNSAIDPLSFSKESVGKIVAAPTLPEKLKLFNELSSNIQLLLSVVQFHVEMIYLQECPSAFGENQPGSWLSRQKEETTNPYGVEDCAEFRTKISDTARLRQMAADTTRR